MKILFGCGEIGKKALVQIGDAHKEKILFCDNNMDKCGQYVAGIEVIHSSELCNIVNNEYEIYITCGKWEDVYIQLKKLNVLDKVFGVYDPYANKFVSIENMYTVTSWSQDGEDILLESIFSSKINSGYKGIYVDIGAHHPFRFSNTYWAYKIGWRGVNIEPDKELFSKLVEFRTEDINVNVGIANMKGIKKYYVYEEKACNTFDEEIYKNVLKPKEIEDIPVEKLKDILQANNITNIDFMSIDVEGYEMDVIRSNDWKRFRPYILLVEQVSDIVEIMESEIYQYLVECGYCLTDKYNRTAVYRDKKVV